MIQDSKFENSFVPDTQDTSTNYLGKLFTLATFSLWCLLMLGILTLITGTFSYWDNSSNLKISPPHLKLLCFIFISILGLAFIRKKASRSVALFSAATMLIVIIFSNWFHFRYGLFSHSLLRGEIILLSIFSFLFVYFQKKLAWKSIALFVSVSFIWAFIATSKGNILFSDDNPTFLYRMMLLKENFPHIPFYNPLWNGGIDERAFFATGSLNFFALFSPLIYLYPVEEIYNYLIAGLLFIFLPIVFAYSAKLEGLNRRGQCITAILSLSTCILWYRWSLQYGTLGFVTTAILVPLNISLASYFLNKNKNINFFHAVLTTCTISLMLCWSPSGIVFLPIILLALFWYKRVFKQKLVYFVVLALLIINIPWIALFWKASNVSHFLTAEKAQSHNIAHKKSKKTLSVNKKRVFKSKKGGVNFHESLKKIREIGISANPLILLFVIPGLLVLRKCSQIAFGVTLLWLIVLGSIVSPIKPQLELDRMLVLAVLVGVIPAANGINKLITIAHRNRKFTPKLLSAITIGFLFSGLFATGAILKNRTLVPIIFADKLLPNITKAITEHGGTGRVLFSGFVLHDLSGGHLAPLALLTKKPLIASSPVHNLWKYTQVFPKSFIKRGDTGIDEYIKLYNISSVFAHEKKWKDYFTKRPDHYKKVWEFQKFQLFQVIAPANNYFLSGNGETIKQDSHAVTIRMSSNEAIVSFHYFPFLAEDNCTFSPYPISEEKSFLKISNCKDKSKIIIRAISPIKRLFL